MRPTIANSNPALVCLLSVALLACSGSDQSAQTDRATETATAKVPTAFYGSWVRDEPKRTPPALEPDHYDRTEYEISSEAGQTTGPAVQLTKWTAALAIDTRKQWFRDKISGPLSCTYIPDRQCLTCGQERQIIKDSLVLIDGNLMNRSPMASRQSAAGRPLVFTRKP
jgi:hypothetical protein